MRSLKLLLPLATVLLATAACGSGTSGSGSGGSGTPVTVSAHDFAFDAVTTSVAPGAAVTVTFMNTGQHTHSFTLDSPSGGGETQADPGQSSTLAFTAPQSGSIQFHCKFHPSQMTGTITVGSGGGSGSSTGAG